MIKTNINLWTTNEFSAYVPNLPGLSFTKSLEALRY